MVQSGGITFFLPDDEGELHCYSVTVKIDTSVEAPEITDSLGNSYVKED